MWLHFSVTLWRKIKNAIFKLCAELCRSEVFLDKDAYDNFFNNSQTARLSEGDSLGLNTPISINDHRDAPLDMSHGKSSSLDVISGKLYMTFWDGLGPLLFDMIQSSLDRQCFSRVVNIAITLLLLKI